jgi:murein L,D-transpeptidase YafK
MSQRWMMGPALALAAVMAVGAAARGDDGFETQQRRYPRVVAAFADHGTAWAARFRDAGAAWPPRGLYLRAFKLEGELELWAAPGPGAANPDALVKVHVFPICAASGGPGLKLREGDLQVPEGFYRIHRFNPRSSFHLSLGLDYPNAWDRARARAARVPPGGDIYIHGGCATIGCLPLGDEAIAGLYLAAVKARARAAEKLDVHVFPCRPGTARCLEHQRLAPAAVRDDADTRKVWKLLAETAAAFGKTRVRPDVRVSARGYSWTDAPRVSP